MVDPLEEARAERDRICAPMAPEEAATLRDALCALMGKSVDEAIAEVLANKRFEDGLRRELGLRPVAAPFPPVEVLTPIGRMGQARAVLKAAGTANGLPGFASWFEDALTAGADAWEGRPGEKSGEDVLRDIEEARARLCAPGPMRGRIVIETTTGRVFRFDGRRWVEEKGEPDGGWMGEGEGSGIRNQGSGGRW